MFCVLFLMFTIKYLKISNEFYLDNLVYCNIDYINSKNKDKEKINIDPNQFMDVNPIINTKWDQDFKWSYPRLDCELCKSCGIDPIVSYGDKQFYDMCRNSNEWWPNDMIRSFAVLLNHKCHHGNTVYVDCDVNPKRTVKRNVYLEKSITSIASFFWKGHHFVAAKLSLKDFDVIIYDGLMGDVSKWKDHVTFICERAGLNSKTYMTNIRLLPSTSCTKTK